MRKFIPVFEPYLTGNEKKYLLDCIDTNWISSLGKYILDFEKSLADYHQVNNAIATSSCTTALHLSLKALGIGHGDEVICPALTFIAPANMIVLSGAKLVLVDIDPNTLTIDQKLIEENINHNTKAIIVVHQFGHAAHMDEIMAIADKYDLKIIEDNAESIGGKYKNQLLGTIGEISTLSFFGNKIITTGEGGAILTNDDYINIKCRELRDHGINHKKKYHHVDLGYNYRMTNMQAAVGLAQMEKLDEILQLRKKQMEYYYAQLEGLNGIAVRKYANWCEPVHWMMTITLYDQYNRNNFLKYMKKKGIDCRQMINPVHYADHFKNVFDIEQFPIAENVSRQSVHLPSGTALSRGDIDFIVNTVETFLNN
ncbi:MAG: DegT/DnrJ/EryC1/StrS family aminotransferase [Candidatus Marinimicrobia bacterium]|nr:DegT/DnrJ/EryC1/StrS family aminotransferase [Candidatus Neomarinimicrobiota bacterium]